MKNVRPRLCYFMVVLLLLSVAGCYRPVLQSAHRDVNASVSEPNTIGYYLPKGMVHISFFPEEKEQSTLTIDSVIIPDPEHFYTMNYCASAFSDDVVEVEFDTGGTKKGRPIFIKKINTSVTDRWVDIVDKLAAISKEFGKLARPFPGAKVAMPQVKYGQYLDVVLDPDDAQALQRVNEFISPYGIAVKIEPFGFDKSAVTAGPRDQKGIYTRMSLPYKVSVIAKLSSAEFTQRIDDEETKTVKIQGVIRTTILNLPNGGPILAPDITRALFVKKDTILNFNQGRLTDYQLIKPSEALGFVMIPYNLAQDIIKLPGELFKLKIALPTKQAELLQEKAAVIYYRNKILEEKGKTADPNVILH